ncbi:hypothetical protein Esti_003457 [Eimeria stiedai]
MQAAPFQAFEGWSPSARRVHLRTPPRALSRAPSQSPPSSEEAWDSFAGFEGHVLLSPEDSVPFSVSIPRADLVSGGFFLSHTNYVVQWCDMGCIRTVYRRFREFANLNEEIKAIRRHRSQLSSRPELLGPLDRTYTGSSHPSPHAASHAAADTAPAARAGDALQQEQQRQEEDYGGRDIGLQRPHWSVPWLLSILRSKCGRAALEGPTGSLRGPPVRLPPKTLLRSQRPDFVEQRRQQLEAYLRALLRREDVLRAWPLWGFLQGSPEARELARFFACSDPHKLRAPSRDVVGHLDDSLSALQRMGCSSRSSGSSSSSGRRGRLPWRLRHPAVGRRLLSLCGSCCDLPLTTRARLIDLLLLLLQDSSSLEVLCSNEALDRALCMLENASMLLSSICCPFTCKTPQGGPPSGRPSNERSHRSSGEGRGKFSEGDQRGDSRQQQTAVSPRGSERLASSSSSSRGLQQQDAAAGAGHRLRSSFKDSATKARGPPSPESARSPRGGRGGAGEDVGGGALEHQGSLPLARLALLLLLIDACTSFLCRLVEAEPLQLLEFCKTPDGFFRLNTLLQHRTEQQQQQLQQQETEAAEPSSRSRGEAARSGGGGGASSRASTTRLKGGAPSPGLSASGLGAPSTGASLADGFAISDGSGAEEGKEEAPAAAGQQQGSGERQQEKLARRLVLLGAPFVCTSPSSTFRKALHAANSAAAAAAAAAAVPAVAAAAAAARSSIGKGACGLACSSQQWPLAAGGPPTSHGESGGSLEELLEETIPPPQLLAEACMQAADARLHVSVGLMLLNSIHLVEIQRALTQPRSSGMELLARLYGCCVSSSSRLVASLLLAVLLKSGRFCCDPQQPPLLPLPSLQQRLLELLHGENQLLSSTSSLLRDLTKWQQHATPQSTAAVQRAHHDQQQQQQQQWESQEGSQWVDAAAGSPIDCSLTQQQQQQQEHQKRGAKTAAQEERTARAAEAISALPLLLTLEALKAPPWKRGVSSKAVEVDFLKFLLRPVSLHALGCLLSSEASACCWSPACTQKPSASARGPPSEEASSSSSSSSRSAESGSPASSPGSGNRMTGSSSSCRDTSAHAWEAEVAFTVCWLLAAAAEQSSKEFTELQQQHEKQRELSLALQGVTPHKLQLGLDAATAAAADFVEQQQQQSVASSEPSPSKLCEARGGRGSGSRARAAAAAAAAALQQQQQQQQQASEEWRGVPDPEGLLILQDVSLFRAPSSSVEGPPPTCARSGAAPPAYDVTAGGGPPGQGGLLPRQLLQQLLQLLQYSSSSVVQRLAALVLLWSPSWWLQLAAWGEGGSQLAAASHTPAAAAAAGVSEKESGESLLRGDPETRRQRKAMRGAEGLSLSPSDPQQLLRGLEAAQASVFRLHAYLVLLQQLMEETEQHGKLVLTHQQQLQLRLQLAAARGVVLLQDPFQRRQQQQQQSVVMQSGGSQPEALLHGAETAVCMRGGGTPPREAPSPPSNFAVFPAGCAENSSSSSSSFGSPEDNAAIAQDSSGETGRSLGICGAQMNKALQGCRELSSQRLLLQQQLATYKAYVEMTRNKLEALRLRAMSAEQQVAPELLPLLALAASLQREEAEALELLESAKVEANAAAEELQIHLNKHRRAKQSLDSSKADLTSLQRSANRLKAQLAETQQLIASAPQRRKQLLGQLESKQQLLQHLKRNHEEASYRVTELRVQLAAARRDEALYKQLGRLCAAIEATAKADGSAAASRAAVQAALAELKQGSSKDREWGVGLEVEQHEPSADIGAFPASQQCPSADALLAALTSEQQLLLQRMRQQQQQQGRQGSEGDVQPAEQQVSVGGSRGAAAAAAARAHRLADALAEAEEACMHAAADVRGQEQQLAHAGRLVEQQTSFSLLSERAEALQTQLTSAESDVKGTEEYVAQLQKEREVTFQGVAEAEKKLQQLQQAEALRMEALAKRREAKREGHERLNRLLLKAEAELRDQWSGVLQLVRDHRNIRVLRRGLDLLLLHEQAARAGLQQHLRGAAAAAEGCLRALRSIDDACLVRLAHKYELPFPSLSEGE